MAYERPGRKRHRRQALLPLRLPRVHKKRGRRNDEYDIAGFHFDMLDFWFSDHSDVGATSAAMPSAIRTR